MRAFLVLLVASVFLGTEFLAIPTPLIQITLYRVLALCVPILLVHQVLVQSPNLVLKKNSVAGFTVAVYMLWYLWACLSGIWSMDTKGWIQTIFLMTIGLASVLALYLWVNGEETLNLLLDVVWVMMTLLALLGLFEVLTNHYFFADMEKLDKYETFISQPHTRMPITHFSNQNDFATMLLAYLALSAIQYYKESYWLKRLLAIASFALGFFLIVMTRSRMSLLAALLFIVISLAYRYKLGLSSKKRNVLLLSLFVLAVLAIILLPPLRNFVAGLIYTGPGDTLNGDTGRVNLFRNGLYFLASTLGIGVGAGNIEYWMENFRFLPTQDIVNMHNWWGEILVAYGVIVFVLYCLSYVMMMVRLTQLRKKMPKQAKRVCEQLLAFMWIYILASMTSSNNMLIEWHWVFFGLILVYIKIMEEKYVYPQANREYLQIKGV